MQDAPTSPRSPDGDASAEVDRGALVVVLVLVAAALAHARTLSSGFVLDDVNNVLENRFVQAHDFAAIFRSDFWAGAWQRTGYYRPLLVSSFAVDHVVGGLRPAGYHATNLVLHLLATALLFRVGRKTFGFPAWAAALAALLFALHPVQTESVAGISNRGDPLVAVFALALLCAHRAATAAREHAGRLGGSLVAILAYAAACLSKENGVLAIALVLGADLFLDSGGDVRAWFRAVRRRAPLFVAYAAVLVAFLAVRTSITGGLLKPTHDLLDNPLAAEPVGTRALLALSVLGKALGLMAWPAALSADYSYGALPTALRETRSDLLLGTCGVALALAGLAWSWKKHPVSALGIAWALVTYLLTSNLLFPVDAMFAERFLYLPMIGVAIAVADVVRRVAPTAVASRRTLGAVALGAALVAAGVRTAVRHGDWKDARTLFDAAAGTTPGSARVQFQLARLHEDAGELEAAARAYGAAVAIWPGYAEALSDRASVLSLLGDHPGAIESAERATTLRPLDPLCWNNLGVARLRARDLPGAGAAFDAALRLAPPGSPYQTAALQNLRIVRTRLSR